MQYNQFYSSPVKSSSGWWGIFLAFLALCAVGFFIWWYNRKKNDELSDKTDNLDDLSTPFFPSDLKGY